MEIINKISNWFANIFNIVKGWVLVNKKLSIIIAVAVVAVLAFAVLFFTVIKPKWDYSHKKVGDTGHTQSEIDEIGDWWDEYLKGDNIINPGEITAK